MTKPPGLAWGIFSPRLGATKPMRCIGGRYRWVKATEPPLRSAGRPVTAARSSKKSITRVWAKMRVTSSQSLRL